MTLPTFKEFVTDPIKAILFIALIVIGYLYVDIKSNYETRISKQDARIEVLETQVKELQEELIETIKLINE